MRIQSLDSSYLPPAQRALLVAALLALLSPAGAGVYDVTHNFTLSPKGNVVPQVQAVYYAHAWAQTVRPNCSDADVEPAAGTQPVGWGRLARSGWLRRASCGTVTARTVCLPRWAG